jgi:hypothetical protein
MRISLAAVLISLVCSARPAVADTITIQPGEILRATFTTLAAPDCSAGGGPCDKLVFDFGFTNNVNGARITTAKLFDLHTLLGTFETDTCSVLGTCGGLAPYFVAAGAISSPDATVIDFTSILNETTLVLDVTLDKPIDFDLNSTFNFFGVGHSTNPFGGSGGYIKRFDSVTVVPEPPSITLLAVSLGSLVVYRRKRTARFQSPT